MGTERRQVKKARAAEARKAREKAARRKRVFKAVTFVAVIALLFTGIAVFNAIRSNDSESATDDCPAVDGSSTRRIQFDEPPPNCLDANARYTATFDTTEGRMVVDLDTANTPDTVNNFVYLARYSYYDNTQIFRTEKSIDIVQGGSPTTNTGSDPGPGYELADEGSRSFTYADGDLVMARSSNPDGSYKPNAAGAQYFFSTGPNTASLPGDYVKFARVSEGLDVLDKMMALDQADSDAPSRPITVNEVTIAQI